MTTTPMTLFATPFSVFPSYKKCHRYSYFCPWRDDIIGFDVREIESVGMVWFLTALICGQLQRAVKRTQRGPSPLKCLLMRSDITAGSNVLW